MNQDKHPQSEGRWGNAAEPLGEYVALGGRKEVDRTGKKSRAEAGPDGPDAKLIGDTFKHGTKGYRLMTRKIRQGYPTYDEPSLEKPLADAPTTPEEVAQNPPTREGGADAGRTADDPGRGGD